MEALNELVKCPKCRRIGFLRPHFDFSIEHTRGSCKISKSLAYRCAPIKLDHENMKIIRNVTRFLGDE